ncbi:hypothetical protein QP166_04715 [Sphingomonas sp. LR60]|uniref:hypothetical protein n=1 Tax=Sphingomonas sp. LR60 TaxID=3050233 RepID=UPI002FE38A8D
MKDWAAVVDAGIALPGVTLDVSYGKPALKFRGKTLAGTTAPDSNSFVLHVAGDEKQVLIETDPATFWETDHYRGWPAVLVRYGSDATERIALLLSRAWWDRATAAQRSLFGGRP